MKLIRIHYHTDRGVKITEFEVEYHPEALAVYEEMGLIDIEEGSISYEDLRRLNKILRLKKRCGVNTIGASIIVDLLEKIEILQDEIERLRRM